MCKIAVSARNGLAGARLARGHFLTEAGRTATEAAAGTPEAAAAFPLGKRTPLVRPNPRMERETLDDRWVRAVGIPGFGISIPHLTGLFGPYGPRQPLYWLGLAWFIGLASAIWHSNRWLLFKQRASNGWFDHPVRKIVALVASTVLGTVPVTLLMLVVWYQFASFPEPDWAKIRTVTLANVICVLFVTHVYETVFLIKEREADLVRVARLERAAALAELGALQAQIDPHFLFNALNTLSYLIGAEPTRAKRFNDRLARVYRYILSQRDRPLVLLSDELGFASDYAELCRERFGEGALDLVLEVPEPEQHRRVLPPLAVQLLVENAVKHNELSQALPLVVKISLSDGALTVENPRRPRPLDRPSARVGLSSLKERYRLATGRTVAVAETDDQFVVTLPLLSV